MATAQSYGAFVPTTNVWDVGQIYETKGITPELKELLVRLYQNLNIMSLVINVKDSGYYDTQEFVNSQLWFPNPVLTSASSTVPAFRQVLRTVVNFGALPDTTTKSMPHNITCTTATTFTRIYATASDTTAEIYLPIPYVSSVGIADNIELNVDNTDVNITTGVDYSAYNICYVVLEYIQT